MLLISPRAVRITLCAYGLLLITACGGGSINTPRVTPGDTPPKPTPGQSGPIKPTPINPPTPGAQPDATDRDLFAQTVHPLLTEYCATCHAGTIPTLSRFAAADVSVAYTATLAGNFVTLSAPLQSKFVLRLVPDNHFCWTDCATNANTMTDAIGKWARLAAEVQNPLNSNPTANPDRATTATSTAFITGNVLTNDTDPENESLSIVSFDAISAEEGTVINNNDGTFTYTSTATFSGTDTFTYTISDPLGGVAIGVVTITVVSPPVAIADHFSSFTDLGIITDDVLKNDFDPAKTDLIISAFDARSLHGGSVATGSGRGQFSYNPALGFTGTDNFSYTMTNSAGFTASTTVFISVGPPVQDDADRFLAFLNSSAPQFQEDAASAASYYATIDPNDTRTTFDLWRAATGLINGADATAIYVNNADLGFSRRMVVRTDQASGLVASYVENYATLDDAINQTNLIATVAMEYAPAAGQPATSTAHWLTTFYVFGPNGTREPGADLDGRGFKFVPGLCNICHGGEPLPLNADGTYPNAGDTGAGFLPWDLDTYLYSNTPELTRAAQESQFKIFNTMILSTRPPAAERELVEGWYGGPGLPNSTFDGTFVPAGWRTPLAPTGSEDLYTHVVGPNCRACHIMQGRLEQSDIDFATYTKFISFSDRIQQLVFDQATMPLALRTYEQLWNNTDAINLLAQYLPNFTRGLSDGSTLTPGRPLADSGPSFTTALGRVDLSGRASVFTGGRTAFNWELLIRPAESQASLGSTSSSTTSFNADALGVYVINLFVNDGIAGTPASAPAQLVIQASPTLQPVTFTRDITPLVLQCTACHKGGGLVDFGTASTRYDNIRRLVNTDAPAASLLLTKPSGAHHAGGTQNGFEDPRGSARETVLRWILAGAKNN